MSKPRNPYENEIDFSKLGLKFAEFNKHLKKNGQLDFSDPEAVKQLTYSLLKRDFDIQLRLPDDRLCPPASVPNRLNYILWLQDLIDTTGDAYDDAYNPLREVTGLDIGTGASCIYPLLGCVQRAKWRFAATEADAKNLEYARQNVLLNNLESRIRPMPTSLDANLILLDDLGLDNIDFTMCNPPFYSSKAEMLESAKAKSRPPLSACTGAEIEMVTQGGEVAFVRKMLTESSGLKRRVQWFTSMLGKLSSLEVIIEELRKAGISNWAVTEFIQGQKTRRWAIAWSWMDMRPNITAARGSGSLPKHLLPFPSEFHAFVERSDAQYVAAKIDTTMKGLDLAWKYRSAALSGVGFAMKNVWSRSARRHIQKQQEQDADVTAMEEDKEAALGFRISVSPRSDSSDVVDICVRWIQGEDHVLFESFCGMVKRFIS